MINFGSALEARGRQADTGAAADVSLNRAAEAWRLAATATTAATPDRIVAAALWGRLSAQRGRWAEAADAYADAAAALDTLAWHGIGRGDHEYLLQGWHDLARDASACAIGDDRITAAVELLDAGRGVLWSRQLELRADLSGLDRAAPSLAADLRRVRAALDTPATVAR